MHKAKILFILMLFTPAAHAAANLQVTAFACNPNEVVNNAQFSCTATVQNTGDASGTLNTATLYPDAAAWLENSNYPETVNVAITSGASQEIVFNDLRGKKSGENGFSRILLDDVTDTYAADNAVKVNVINVISTVTASASSAAAGAAVDVTGQATAGGNVDITLTFSVNSGGCSIGNQLPSVTTNGMGNSQTTSHTWTVTMGTATCSYAVLAKATSKPSGTASKTDTTSGSISCSSGCTTPTSESGSSTASSGGGGGGGGNITTNNGTNVKAQQNPDASVAVCRPSWDCGLWGDCSDGKQQRTCIDLNKCAGAEKPEEQRPCEIFGSTDLSTFVEAVKDYSVWIAMFLAASIVLGYLYYHGHRHLRKAKRFIYSNQRKSLQLPPDHRTPRMLLRQI